VYDTQEPLMNTSGEESGRLGARYSEVERPIPEQRIEGDINHG
jgi:hypothetical protein